MRTSEKQHILLRKITLQPWIPSKTRSMYMTFSRSHVRYVSSSGGYCFGQKLLVKPTSSPAHFESWWQKTQLFTPCSDLASFFTVADLSPPPEFWVHGRHRANVSDPVSSVTHVCHLCSLSFCWLIVGAGEQSGQRQPEAPGSTYTVTEKELMRHFLLLSSCSCLYTTFPSILFSPD